MSADRPLSHDATHPGDRSTTTAYAIDDGKISSLVARLARPHASGGVVIERAAILAAGTDLRAVTDWIVAHGGQPEALAAAPARGLHGSRLNDRGVTDSRPPLRFVLPPGA
jgi:hypothetical protein